MIRIWISQELVPELEGIEYISGLKPTMAYGLTAARMQLQR
ncbi:hypothetical protein SDC9_201006 [bioreactor metagenome]|uniref:Uncharacterized protein n=1 Tax=bioreactor metagenome TaxID=1076179 RepID=A0A645IR22_9ZZZZ